VQVTVEITENIKSELRFGEALTMYVADQLFLVHHCRRENSQLMEITPGSLNSIYKQKRGKSAAIAGESMKVKFYASAASSLLIN
jgi:hypothetical protein